MGIPESEQAVTEKNENEPLQQKETVSANQVASGATFLIGAQFFAKIVTFSLNQLLLRFIDPEIFGQNAQLQFLISTILYFSREAVRLATQRQTLADKSAMFIDLKVGL